MEEVRTVVLGLLVNNIEPLAKVATIFICASVATKQWLLLPGGQNDRNRRKNPHSAIESICDFCKV